VSTYYPDIELMYHEILVPTDGSESIATVLEHTRAVAQGRDARVHALYVVDDRAFLTLDDEMKDDVVENLRQEGAAAVGEASEQLDAADVEVTTAITKGKPADEIIAYVEENGIDLVTMGTRGDDTENLLGSTAQTVVANAPAPVLTVNLAGE
jgi:nucleotide-binding universal stress UspA family protein